MRVGTNSAMTETVRDDDMDFSWQSTPQLWAAMRKDYDGAIDSKCPIGFGKTKEEAAADLIERETA